MTFSMVARCARTGMFGAVVTTSSIAVGSRCTHVRAKSGAVLSQYRTDPALGARGLELLTLGKSARETIDGLIAGNPHHGWRQLAVIDAQGRTAHFSGQHVQSFHAGVDGEDCVAIANIVQNFEVPAAMVRVFEADPALPLATRLVRALAAGDAAGGEFKPLVSAALLVAHEQNFAFVDLRVDEHADPIGELGRLWRMYEPLAEQYVLRATDPDRVEGKT